MSERREHPRYGVKDKVAGHFVLKEKVRGHFPNYEKFDLINISSGGFKLFSNFSPIIGTSYQITFDEVVEKIQFDIRILHSSIDRFLSEQEDIFNAGAVFSIGCKVTRINSSQKEFIRDLIKNKCEFVAEPETK